MFEQLRPILPATAAEVDGVLHVGGASIRDLADRFGTPLIA